MRTGHLLVQLEASITQGAQELAAIGVEADWGRQGDPAAYMKCILVSGDKTALGR